MPSLTIGLLVYNDIHFVEEAINSLLNQKYKDFVMVIADDASTDGSEHVCRKYAELDHRIKYIRHPKNMGISRNMRFLLDQCETPFFMWAADDDLWSPNFAHTLINKLEENPFASVAFGTFITVDEQGQGPSLPKNFDYSGLTKFERLKKLIHHPNDSFGYGVFRTEKIRNVEFPIWWWPNRNTPYNNIFPTLCYYLSVGEFVHATGEPLFINRFKEADKIHHKLPFPENSFKESLAFTIRKFNLITFSTKLIRKATEPFFALKVYPLLFSNWFFKEAWLKWKHYFKLKLMGKKFLK